MIGTMTIPDGATENMPMTRTAATHRTFLLLAALLLAGGLTKIARADDEAAQLARGAEIFAANCANGSGGPRH